MPELYSLDDLRRVFGAEKGRELGRVLWAATQKPIPEQQLEALRLFAEGEELGQAQGRLIPPLRVFLRDHPAVARRMALWASETIATGGVPGGMPGELQDDDQQQLPLSSSNGAADELLRALTVDPVSIRVIAGAVGKSTSRIGATLRRLAEEGRVVRVESGLTNLNQGPRYLWRLP